MDGSSLELCHIPSSPMQIGLKSWKNIWQWVNTLVFRFVHQNGWYWKCSSSYIYNIIYIYIYRRTSSMFSPSWNSEKLAPRPPPPPPPAVRWRRPTAGWVRSEASWCKRPRRPAHGAPAPRRADAVGHDSRHSTWVAGVYPIYPRKNVSFNGILRGYVIIDDISGSEDRIDHQNCSF